MTNPTPLSPAAQAVLDAFTADDYGVWLEGDPDRLAAALHAAADRCSSVDYYGSEMIRVEQLLAIAAELENNAN